MSSIQLSNHTGTGSPIKPFSVAADLTKNNSSPSNGAHGYCLKWKFHPNNLLHMFNQLLLNESFTDVIVACEGKVIKCHKMVLSACSKYFEQIFTEYPQQNSTLVILKDMKFSDVQAIIEFMYQGEINVAHDQLPSLLKSAESLQVKGLADITGGKTTMTEDPVDFSYGGPNSGDDSAPVSPRPPTSESGSIDHSRKRKRTNHSPKAPLNFSMDSSSMDGMNHADIQGGTSGSGNPYDEFSLSNLLEAHYSSPRGASKKVHKKKTLLSTHMAGDLEDPTSMDDDDHSTNCDDDEVTEEDIQQIVKMTDYIEKGGSRPQFWEEPTTKKIMNAIRSKKIEMKAAAEILGVSYSTLYSRYRELHGYLKMPHTQDTNFNYYQVLNLLRAGQISLPDAAKRLNIHEKTLGAYLTTSITPKKPRVPTVGSPDSAALALMANLQGAQVNALMESVIDSNKQNVVDDYEEEDDESGDDGVDTGGVEPSDLSTNV